MPSMALPVAVEPEQIVGVEEEPVEDLEVSGIRPGDKVDLLFVVDNSTSMGDKQALFTRAVPDLLDMLVNPPCVDRLGDSDPSNDVLVDFTAEGACPTGTQKIFLPVTDIHLAVISSSLGEHGLGGDNPVCPDEPHKNDKAHLIPFVRPEAPDLIPSSYQGLGFLVWDSAQTAVPPGDSDQQTLVQKFQAQVSAVRESGCGFEAPLEAAYRFLIDPSPYESLVRVPCQEGALEANCVQPQGVDTEVLIERQNFLRPDSHLVVTYLTDENDCSIKDSGQGYYTMRPLEPMPRGTAACADPNHTCCQSCATTIREGCEADPAINGCVDSLDPFEASPAQLVEAFNVRCFDQKRRYGIDLLYKTQRYLDGFKNDMIAGPDGTAVPNPLFAGGRRQKQVFVVGIVGTPWQDIVTDVNDPAGRVKRAEFLPWELFLPSAASPVALDPFNVEDTRIRQGTNPITNDVLGGPGTVNGINGHDRVITSGDGLTDDLQYACTFPLPEPRDCAAAEANADNCDCTQTPNPVDNAILDYATGNPLCQAPDGTYGTIQYRAKAYPGPRMMEVVRGMEKQGVLGSICPRNASDPSLQDYGYRPPIRALMLGLASDAF